jgi:branched-chain amino acid transport system substrate-binding protein
MGSQTYRIGILLSQTGSYSVVTRSMLNGVRLGLAEVNAAGEHTGVVLEAVEVNPGGCLARYADFAQAMLSDGIRHIVGCYTSASRKEVIPYFEKHDGLLWYPSHYEGFESSNNVIYTGASPNQHIIPLVDYLSTTVGCRAYCIGSNYIWAWENNRILRERLSAKGGSVIGERYFALGDTDLEKTIDLIIEERPDFVFTTLIGTSAYAFFRKFRAASEARGINQARVMPVASCTLSEPELEEIGAAAVDGQISSSVYFSSLPSAENRRFVAAYDAAFPAGPVPSADAEASYIAVKLLAMALERARTDAIAAVKDAVADRHLAAPQGDVWINGQTFHAHLTPRIAISNRRARFDLVMEAPEPVRPDPYLVEMSPRFALASTPRIRRIA